MPLYGMRGDNLDALLRASAIINEGEQDALPARGYDPPVLFTVHQMAVQGEDRWGVRHYEGSWWPQNYATREEAEERLNTLLCRWLEGEESLLIVGFAKTQAVVYGLG